MARAESSYIIAKAEAHVSVKNILGWFRTMMI